MIYNHCNSAFMQILEQKKQEVRRLYILKNQY